MRDHLKDVDYFITFIDEELSRIDRFALQLERGEIAPERIIPVKAVMHNLRLGILTAKYSKGDDLSLLEQEYLSILDEWEEVWVPDSIHNLYCTIPWINICLIVRFPLLQTQAPAMYERT